MVFNYFERYVINLLILGSEGSLIEILHKRIFLVEKSICQFVTVAIKLFALEWKVNVTEMKNKSLKLGWEKLIASMFSDLSLILEFFLK